MSRRIVAVDQDTEAWHKDFRAGGIGSSESPAVLNIGPYGNALDLWEVRSGLKAPKKSNWAMEQGKYWEPAAREIYQDLTEANGCRVIAQPTCFISDIEFIRASLDGYDAERQINSEFKVPSTEKSFIAGKEKIPEHHYVQVQYQLFCSGARLAHYFVFNHQFGHYMHVVPRDEAMIARIVKEVTHFWECLQNKMPPDPEKWAKRLEWRAKRQLIPTKQELEW